MGNVKLDYVRLSETMSKRAKKPLTTLELSEKLGVNHMSLHKWSKGESLKTVELITKIMEKSGLTFNQLFNVK